MTKVQVAERDEARKELRNLFEQEKIERVYTILRHVAQSGMIRVVDLYIIGLDRRPRRITWTACKAIDAKYNRKHEGMELGGCGMDVGFEAVYNLSMALYCPTDYSHDAAYQLKQEWL